MEMALGAFEMLRTGWLAFVCLLSLVATFALKSTRSANTAANLAAGVPRDLAALATSISEPEPAVNSASKADRLPIAFPDAEMRQADVAMNRVASVQVETASEPTLRQITSWHWHAGSNKVTRK
jgi:hypothetical protein